VSRLAAGLLAGSILAIAGAGCRVAQPTGTLVASTPDISSPVVGVVVSVDAAGLNDVRGFVLRVQGAFAFDFVVGQLENPTEFPPGHLAEHQATSQPVRVFFRLDNGERVAYRLEDAAG
jgi:hypothetical protein